MPTDANSLALGQISGVSSSTPAQGTVIIQNSNGEYNSSTAICKTDPTNSVSLDLLKIGICSGQVLQWQFDNTGENAADALLVWNGNFWTNLASQCSNLYPGLDGATAYANEVSGVLERTLPVQNFVGGLRRFNEIIGIDGIVVNNFSIQVSLAGANAAANQQFIDNPLTTFVIPINPNDSYNKMVNYPDFCDACFTTNNGNNSTRSYNLIMGSSRRTGWFIKIPAGANGTIRVTVAGVALPNNEFEGGAFTIGA